MAATSTGRAPTSGSARAVPGAYWAWLGGTTLSLVGVQAMAFAMAWVAAGEGGGFAALVLTAVNLPRALLLLVGGAVADRLGAWTVMVVSDAAMVVVTVALAAAVWSAANPWLPLLLAALAIGVVDAFYLPSTGSMPRRLVAPAGLARAMSARHLAGQLAMFVGPAAGSLLLAALGLAAVALANAAGFALMLLVLMVLRAALTVRPGESPGQPAGQLPGRPVAQPLWRAAVDGLLLAAAHAVLRPALLLVGVAAGFLLPVSGLLVPLLGRERMWSSSATGAVVAALALGTATVAILVLVRGALPDPGRVSGAALLVAAGGVVTLAAAGSLPTSVAAGMVIGVGSGGFATHVGPLILAVAPDTHVSRVQSVLVLVQSLPLLLTLNVLGSLAEVVPVAALLYGCAGVLAVAAVTALTSPSLRRADRR
ncbi:MFS transporter [Micromonospora sp. NPDC048871]|uniref:MFS transporter n=1 Tax=unclassified Micromonospora TaxID=2617518 RepID=UPI002E0D533D|nr:MFS transporter [Micromonospora sp. NBC_01739]